MDEMGSVNEDNDAETWRNKVVVHYGDVLRKKGQPSVLHNVQLLIPVLV